MYAQSFMIYKKTHSFPQKSSPAVAFVIIYKTFPFSSGYFRLQVRTWLLYFKDLVWYLSICLLFTWPGTSLQFSVNEMHINTSTWQIIISFSHTSQAGIGLNVSLFRKDWWSVSADCFNLNHLMNRVAQTINSLFGWFILLDYIMTGSGEREWVFGDCKWILNQSNKN